MKTIGVAILNVQYTSGAPNVENLYTTSSVTQTIETVIGAFNLSSWGQIRNNHEIEVFEYTLQDYTHTSVSYDSHVENTVCDKMKTENPSKTFYVCGVLNPMYAGGVLGWAYLGTRQYDNQDAATRAHFMIYGQQNWIIFAHEIGHLFGLHHSGSSEDTSYYEYKSDDIMGNRFAYLPYNDYNVHASDFNIVSRFQLGWIPASRLALFPGETLVTMQSLSGSPSTTYDVGLSALCQFCKPLNDDADDGHYGGQLFLSYRTVDSQDYPYIKNIFNEDSILQYRVHVHFFMGKHHDTSAYSNEGKKNEFWMSLFVNESFTVPGSNSAYGLYIHVCDMVCNDASCPLPIRKLTALSETATVSISNVSAIDAKNMCYRGQSPL